MKQHGMWLYKIRSFETKSTKKEKKVPENNNLPHKQTIKQHQQKL
jgi:hypothetical protein